MYDCFSRFCSSLLWSSDAFSASWYALFSWACASCAACIRILFRIVVARRVVFVRFASISLYWTEAWTKLLTISPFSWLYFCRMP